MMHDCKLEYKRENAALPGNQASCISVKAFLTSDLLQRRGLEGWHDTDGIVADDLVPLFFAECFENDSILIRVKPYKLRAVYSNDEGAFWLWVFDSILDWRERMLKIRTGIIDVAICCVLIRVQLNDLSTSVIINRKFCVGGGAHLYTLDLCFLCYWWMSVFPFLRMIESCNLTALVRTSCEPLFTIPCHLLSGYQHT